MFIVWTALEHYTDNSRGLPLALTRVVARVVVRRPACSNGLFGRISMNFTMTVHTLDCFGALHGQLPRTTTCTTTRGSPRGSPPARMLQWLIRANFHELYN